MSSAAWAPQILGVFWKLIEGTGSEEKGVQFGNPTALAMVRVDELSLNGVLVYAVCAYA